MSAGIPLALERLAAVRVYVVATPAAHGASWDRALVTALATGQVGMVQLREKTLDDRAFVKRAKRLRRLCNAHGALLVLNDRVHLVEEAQADGVHVGQDDAPPEQAREILGPDRLVGLSTHDEAEVAAAAGRGADHIGLGPCFRTPTKQLTRPPGGADLVRRCLPHALGLVVFPIGGVTPASAATLAAAGARRVAIGAGVLEARDPAEAVRTVHALFTKGRIRARRISMNEPPPDPARK